MNLQDILTSAVGGFTAGLTVGLAGIPEKYEEKLELVELIPEEKRTSKGGKLTNKKIRELKTKIKLSKRLIPFCAGGFYSSIASIVTSIVSQNPSTFNEKLIVAVPSAYLGKFVGHRIRKHKNREKLEEQKNEIRASVDFKNMHKYLLPTDKQKSLEDAFSELEEEVLNKDEGLDAKDLINPEGACRKVYDVIMENKTKYTDMLLAWSLTKQAEIFKHADLQRKIIGFYERSYEGMPPKPFSVADCAIIGSPEKTKIKVFTKEEGDFYIQTLELPDLKIIKDDKTGIVEVEGKERPEVTSTEREVWTNDYRALTDRFLYEEDADNGYTMMLMQIPSSMPNQMKTDLIMTSFLSAYEKYHSKEDKNGKR
jgi:hypothetical protein